MLRLIVVSLVLAVASAAPGALVITEVAPQTTLNTPSTINGDWWELTNTGPSAVNLEGYQWADTEDQLPSTDTNFFPSFVLNVGQSVVILEEASSNETAWRANWGLADSVEILATDEMIDDSTPEGDTFSGLGNTNDGVFMYDPSGTLLSSYTYVERVRGVTFEADWAGHDLGLSVLGENGAVLAANGDIGSPGTSVPEPATLGMLTLGGISLYRRRS